jgi:hypothetical protein
MNLLDIFEWLSKNSDTANAIAAIASAIMAAVAVFLSVVSIWISRSSLRSQQDHNRISVRPLAYVVIGDYENHQFVKIRNNGTGPLVIKEIKVIGAENPSKPLIYAMPRLYPEVSWQNFVEDCSGRSIPVGGELELLSLNIECSTSEAMYVLARSNVRKALGELEIHVEYTDIYESKLPAARRNLKFFHRNLSIDESIA